MTAEHNLRDIVKEALSDASIEIVHVTPSVIKYPNGGWIYAIIRRRGAEFGEDFYCRNTLKESKCIK